MKELAIEESIRLHRELWNWLAENPNMRKDDWSGWEVLWAQYPDLRNDHSLAKSNCFACYATIENRDNCDCCVLKWPGLDCCSDERDGDDKGLFKNRERTMEADKRKKLAIQIRDLPVRKQANLIEIEERKGEE